MADGTIEHTTCLGCGCACDDIAVVTRGGQIVEARNACPLGVDWFGKGTIPARIRSGDGPRDADLASAIAAAAARLRSASRPLVYLAADLSCESQRAAIAVADMLHALLDTLTGTTASAGILAAQRRGRASASLGEIRNRADIVLFWGTDPATRYPRYTSRYAPEPAGLYLPKGRAGRTVIAVDIGTDRGPADADVRVTVAPADEITALALIRAALLGRALPSPGADTLDARTSALADRLRAGHYVAIVADAEASEGRDVRRSDGLLSLAEALNGPTRCALSTLRAGGNRSGADAMLTAQTGYPMAVDFARGVPRYRPNAGAAQLLAGGAIDVALLVGSAHSVPPALRGPLGKIPCVAIGPRASESPIPTAVAIDTGVAGIHEGGTAFRLDDIPLPLRPALAPPNDTVLVLRALAAAIAAEARAA
jgi:formylmethanofuran dehydrogenase subunit B